MRRGGETNHGSNPPILNTLFSPPCKSHRQVHPGFGSQRGVFDSILTNFHPQKYKKGTEPKNVTFQVHLLENRCS